MTAERVLWQSPGGEAPRWTLALAGDVLPSEPGIAAEEAWRARAARSAVLLAGADRAVVNLECPLDTEGLPPAAKAGLGSSLAGPRAALAYLTELRVAVAGLANNHAYDYGPEGVERTRRACEAAGVAAPGAGATLAAPAAVELLGGPEGPPVAVWVAAGRSLELATATRAGCEVATRERAAEALAAAQAAGAVARVALLHLGLERTNRPDPDDVRLMDDMARLGFDVVAACHSHRTSGYALVDRGERAPAVCLYGLGSLLSTIVYGPLEREGLVAHVGVAADGRVVRVAVRPVLLAADGVGEAADGAAGEEVLDRVESVAEEVRTGRFAAGFYADLSQGLAGRQWRDAVAAFRAGGPRALLHKARRLRVRHVKALLRTVRRRLPGA